MSQSSAWTRKKKEHIGNFKNAGQAWCREPESVLVHDYPQDAIGQAIPYGAYTLNTNQGYVRVGDCFDTPRFAVESIDNCWYEQGRKSFPTPGGFSSWPMPAAPTAAAPACGRRSFKSRSATCTGLR